MNTTTKPASDQHETKQDERNRRDEEQFWTEWWREYAQTWK